MSMYLPKIMHAGSCPGQLFKFHENRSRGLGAVGGRKSPSPIDKAHSLSNSFYYRTSRDNILGITANLCFPMIKHKATKVSADVLYSVRKFSFGNVYTAFVGNLLCRVSQIWDFDLLCCFVGKLQKL